MGKLEGLVAIVVVGRRGLVSIVVGCPVVISIIIVWWALCWLVAIVVVVVGGGGGPEWLVSVVVAVIVVGCPIIIVGLGSVVGAVWVVSQWELVLLDVIIVVAITVSPMAYNFKL